MKQLIIGLVLGAAVALPATAYAEGHMRSAKPIYSIEASTVYVLDDQDNKCYVVEYPYKGSAISCVKR